MRNKTPNVCSKCERGVKGGVYRRLIGLLVLKVIVDDNELECFALKYKSLVPTRGNELQPARGRREGEAEA